MQNAPQQPDIISQIQQIEAQVNQGKYQEVAQQCEKLLPNYPSHAHLHFLRGLAARHLKDRGTAIEYLQKATELNPNILAYYFTLAQQLYDVYQLRSALAAIQKAVQLNPKNDGAYALMGLIYSAGKYYDQAVEAFNKAVTLQDPGNSNVLLTYESLLYIYEMRRDDAGIMEVMASAREKHQDLPPLIVEAKCKRRQGDPEGAVQDLEAIIANPIKANRLPGALIEMGIIQDKLGHYDLAYDYIARGQDTQRQAPLQKARGGDDYFDRVLDGCQQWFDKDKVAGWDHNVPQDGHRPPVFLVGFPRSGTTLTEQILASHAGVGILEEYDILGKMVFEDIQRCLQREIQYPDVLSELAPENILKLRKVYWDFALKLAKEKSIEDKPVIIDKLPFNLKHMGLIQRLFPEAKIIMALRDPRDCCLSAFMQHFMHNSAMKHFYTLEGAVNIYGRVMDLYLKYKEILPLDVLEFRYEDMVEDQEGVSRKLIDHLGLEWDANVLEYYKAENKREIFTPSYDGVSKPIYKTARGRWKHYKKYFEPYQGQLKPYLEAFGYEVVT